jgi:polyisoprenyl-phosphate glycosyltransferase
MDHFLLDSRIISIVLPVFDDLPSVRALIGDLEAAINSAGVRASLVIVDDGSPQSIDPNSLSAGTSFPVQVIQLRRNVGHQRAIAIGLSHVVATELAPIIVIMDGDGEDQPTDIPKLISALASAEPNDIVVAKRANRSEGAVFSICYRMYRALFRFLTGYSIQFGNFSAMRLKSARRLTAMPELWVSLPAAVLRSKLAIRPVPTGRGRRYFGESKMRFVSLVLHGFNAIAVFADRALTRIAMGAAAIVTLTTLASFAAIVMKFVGLASPGWATSIIATSLVLTLLTCVLALIGLLMTLTGGVLFLPQPIDVYQSFIAEILPPAQITAVGRVEARKQK